MCEVNWALLREWVGTLAELATAVLGGLALLTWRRHLRGETKYKVAHKVLEEARLLRYFFYDARNSWYDAGEFPPAYHQMTSEQRTNDDEARAWAYVYEGRYKLVRRQIWILARLRARSGAVLGDEIAAAIETLARKARELGNFMNERVAQYRAGEHIVAQWPDQDWVRRVRDSVEVNPDDHSDRYSREFDEAFEALQRKLRPHT